MNVSTSTYKSYVVPSGVFQPILRINCGGSLVPSVDSFSDWQQNSGGGAQIGVGYSCNNSNAANNGEWSYTRGSSVPAYITNPLLTTLVASTRVNSAVGAILQYILSGLSGPGVFKINLFLDSLDSPPDYAQIILIDGVNYGEVDNTVIAGGYNSVGVWQSGEINSLSGSILLQLQNTDRIYLDAIEVLKQI